MVRKRISFYYRSLFRNSIKLIMLNVGTKVKIKKSSQYYKYNDEYNPRTVGTIIQILGEHLHQYRVQWDTKTNSYSSEDLKEAYQYEIY